MLHLNMRSLPKNLSLPEDLITTVKEPPEIIAISETKLKDIFDGSFRCKDSMKCKV